MRAAAERTAGGRRRWRGLDNPYAFVLPAVVLFGMFTVYPILRSLYLSFFDYEFLHPEQMHWVGSGNYEEIFRDRRVMALPGLVTPKGPLSVWQIACYPLLVLWLTINSPGGALWNTIRFTAMYVPCAVALPLLLAVMVDKAGKLSTLFRTLNFIPVVVSVAVVSIIWMWIYHPEYGVVNTVLSRPGWDARLLAVGITVTAAAMATGWLVAMRLSLAWGWWERPTWVFLGSLQLTSLTFIAVVAVAGSSAAGWYAAGIVWLAAMWISKDRGWWKHPVWVFLASASMACLVPALVVKMVPHLPAMLARAKEAPTWLSDARLAMPSIVAMCVWHGLGFNMLLFLVGLQRIPPELGEAARVDGATGWQALTRVTIPLLRPTIFLVGLLAVIGALKVFGQMFIMTQGGPADSTLSMVLYLYNIAFRYGKFRFGYASALAWFLAVCIFLVALVSFRLSRERE